jgi:NAD(P)-dependent dehydrogenase (short-subunit alcohol dehydrogenase family)
MSSFKNKVVIVTGGNSGIGRAIAEEFDKEGAKLVIFGRNKEKLDQVQKKLRNSIAVAGDVCKISDLDNLFKVTSDKFGKVDVLIANAGIASRKPVDEVDEIYFDEMVNINFKGVYFTVQRAIPFLNNNASIVLISSMACHAGWPSHSVYSSTKAAVSMLAKNFSADLIQRGIRVNAISPGFTATEMYEKNFVTEYKKRIPTGEFAKPEEIAKAAIYLSSPDAISIVGTDLVIDGGFTSIIKE